MSEDDLVTRRVSEMRNRGYEVRHVSWEQLDASFPTDGWNVRIDDTWYSLLGAETHLKLLERVRLAKKAGRTDSEIQNMLEYARQTDTPVCLICGEVAIDGCCECKDE